MRQKLISRSLAATLVALLAGCASTRPTDGGSGAASSAAADGAATTQERALARYKQYAGAPVESFNWLGRFDSWEPLGQAHLLVYTRPNEAYLLKVSGPCDMRFATGPIGITSTNSTVLTGLDSIVVRSGVGGSWQCSIAEMRPVDVRRMTAEARAPGQAPVQR